MAPKQAATAPHRARVRDEASIRLVCTGLLTMTIVTHPWAAGRLGEVSKAFPVEYCPGFLIIPCGSVLSHGCSVRTSDRCSTELRPNAVLRGSSYKVATSPAINMPHGRCGGGRCLVGYRAVLCGRSSGERRTSRTEAWVQSPPSALT